MPDPAPSKISLLPSLIRVALLAPRIERSRNRLGPRPAVAQWRARGLAQPAITEVARDRLRRSIRWVDEKYPGGPNCMRRALLTIAVDPEAAAQPFWIGLNRAPESADEKMIVGHAWVGDDKGNDKDYAVELKL